MKLWIAAATTFVLTACGAGSGIVSTTGTTPSSSAASAVVSPLTGVQRVYWTLFAGVRYPQVQFARVPLRGQSQATSIYHNAHNKLLYTSDLQFDASGNLWILTFGKYGGDPGEAFVFHLPLNATSVPVHRFLLSGTDDPDQLTFDASGNLWVNSHDNDAVFEYRAPLNKNGTLSPAVTLTDGLREPYGIAFDKRGNLYVSNFESGGLDSIAVFTAPIANRKPYFLDGVVTPGGLIFDKSGNLYASSNGASRSAIVRYDSDDLKRGDFPSIVDPAGLYHSFGSNFAFSASGDLYVANCGVDASVYVYPTSTKPFSSKLAPSLDYRDYELSTAGCAWGIAIR